MPRVNIYIRKQDWEEWQMIDNIPDFISRALTRERVEDSLVVKQHVVDEGRTLGKLETPEQEEASEPNLCPHHMIWGACGYASCKKGKQ